MWPEVAFGVSYMDTSGGGSWERPGPMCLPWAPDKRVVQPGLSPVTWGPICHLSASLNADEIITFFFLADVWQFVFC